MSEEFDPLTRGVLKLLAEEPFYAGMLREIKRVYRKCGTAAVAVTQSGNIVMMADPNFFATLSNTEIAAVIKHELLHLIYGHLSKSRVDNMPNRKLANVAMDLSINQQIVGLPDNCLDIAKFDPPLPENKTAEYYYQLLEQRFGSEGAGGQGGEVVDNHDEWQNGDGSGQPCEEIIEAAVKRAVGEGKKAAERQGWGSVANNVRRAVDEILLAKPLSWKKLLRRFAADACKAGTTGTRKKPNRRFGTQTPGQRVLRKARLAVAIDTSGSIFCDPGVLGAFFKEVNKIAAYAEVTVIECDAAVGKIYKWNGKPPEQATGGGGTAFEPACEAAAEMNVSGLIYLTDGWAHFPEKMGNWPDTLWVITDQSRLGLKQFGRDVHMDLEAP